MFPNLPIVITGAAQGDLHVDEKLGNARAHDRRASIVPHLKLVNRQPSGDFCAGASPSMKMGTIASPWRYDVGARIATRQLKRRYPTLALYSLTPHGIVKIPEQRAKEGQ